MKHELPKLPYAYDALEPYIDKETMEIHHTKHHQAYTDKMNGVLEHYPELVDKPLEEIMQGLADSPMSDPDKKAFQNHGGGYLNHILFWNIMGPQKEVDHELVKEIETEFGDMSAFKEQFAKTAAGHFGSGWAWLVRDPKDGLKIYSTSNQDSPLLQSHEPLIGLDLWEHAYYLKYQNRRPEYIENWWSVLKIL